VPGLDFPCPRVVNDGAGALAAAFGVCRRDIFLAAARAVVSRPPVGVVGYTDPRMHVAPGTVRVPLHPELLRTVRDVAKHRFYGRISWLFWWGIAHVRDADNELVHFLRADATVLDRFDGTAYEHWTGGHPCQIPPSARAPRAPSPPRRPRKNHAPPSR